MIKFNSKFSDIVVSQLNSIKDVEDNLDYLSSIMIIEDKDNGLITVKEYHSLLDSEGNLEAMLLNQVKALEFFLSDTTFTISDIKGIEKKYKGKKLGWVDKGYGK
jgi:cytolysin (calcineurin-like family phosphatase)